MISQKMIKVNEDLLIRLIKQNLSDDLLPSERKPGHHPMFGFCGISSIIFWLCTGKQYKLMTGTVHGLLHTWVEDGDRIIDITVEQFEFFEENVSYENKQDYHTKYELNLKSPRIKKLLSRVTNAYKKLNHTNKIGYK